MQEVFDSLSSEHFYASSLMQAYRSGHLDADILRKIDSFLRDDLGSQRAWLTDSSSELLVQAAPITDADIKLWKNTESNMPVARRIAVDQYIKVCFYQHFFKVPGNSVPLKIKQLGHGIFIRRFEAYAKYYPQQIALRFRDQSWTYAQVNQRANQIAWLLKKQGVEKGELVGTFLPRSPDWIIATLAIWKVGAAFVAIDPTVPAGSFKMRLQYLEKFNHLLNEVNLKCIITNALLQIRLPDCKIFCLDALAGVEFDNLNNVYAPVEVLANDLAYVIYTSGSTGKPKGVEIAHRGLMACLEAHRECVDLTQHSVMAQYAAPGFDAWIAEMLILGIGGALSIIPDEIRLDRKALISYSSEHKITAVIFTPQLLKQLGGPENFPSWRALFIVGEKFPWSFVEHWQKGRLQVVNGYGLTETTICATLENLNVLTDNPNHKALSHVGGEDLSHFLPIGRPIVGTEIQLFTPDSENQDEPTPQGERGEICIAGISLLHKYSGETDEQKASYTKNIAG